jgi:hypothetical protein
VKATSLYILLLTLFPYCNNQSHNDVPKKANSIDSLKNILLGNWGGLGESSPVWEIRIDSIYYHQEKKAYSYKIIDSKLIIYRDENNAVFENLSVVKDTLMFTDDIGIKVRAYKFKDKK